MTLVPKLPKDTYENNVKEPVNVDNDVALLKEWLSKQPHLPQDIEEEWLKSFLKGCKYSLEKCKRKIDSFFSIRTAVPEIFSNRDPTSEEIRSTIKSHAQFILPKRHPNNYYILFGRMINPDASIFSFESLFKKALIIADCAIKECDIHDIITVLDCKDSSIQHILKVSPTIMRVAIKCVEEAFPYRIKAVYVINMMPFIQVLVNMIWPMLSENIKQKVHFLTDNLEELYEFVPRELLPQEYGGEAGTVEELNEEFQRTLESYRSYFLKDAERKTDESKRVKGNNKYYEFSYGAEGSFRKLDID